MYLINERIRPVNHCSQDVMNEFEKAILSDSEIKVVKKASQLWFLPLYYLDKLAGKIGLNFTKILTQFFVRDSSCRQDAYFVVLMGKGDFNKIYPYIFFNKRNRIVYFFDAWPKDQPDIIDFINRCKINRIFVSSSEAAIELNKKQDCPIVNWIPEGVDVLAYKQLPYSQKDIDVVQIGRKYDWYHEQILPFFNETGKVYLYERTKGRIIFPSREDFVDGLSRSKISICFPSNITHPDRAGTIETMTNRYLQSMASKCLIVGHAPLEMIEQFGYNPVIEIDRNAPMDQLKTILENYSDYIPFIEENYEIVSKFHTWENRWEQIKILLETKQTCKRFYIQGDELAGSI